MEPHGEAGSIHGRAATTGPATEALAANHGIRKREPMTENFDATVAIALALASPVLVWSIFQSRSDTTGDRVQLFGEVFVVIVAAAHLHERRHGVGTSRMSSRWYGRAKWSRWSTVSRGT
jgi:hypothetical protein